jgi:hypothetical protein
MFIRKSTPDTNILLHRETMQKHGSHDQKTHGKGGKGSGGEPRRRGKDIIDLSVSDRKKFTSRMASAKTMEEARAIIEEFKPKLKAVVKHGSHDQKTHGRGGGGGGSSGGSSSASSASSSSGEKELNGLADSAESDSQSLQNEAEDTQLELTNSGLSNNSPDVRTARIMSQSLKNANKSFKEAKEAKGVDAKKGKLRSGYNSLSRAFDVSNNSEINTLEDIAEGIGRTMEKLEQGLGLDSRS